MTAETKKGVASIDYTLSDEVVKLYNSAEIKNPHEAVTVLFHAFILERGFTPKDVPDEDKYEIMPKDWETKTHNAVFKIKYAHRCCPSFTCCVTFVPLYSTLSVHGIVCDGDCKESVNFKLNINQYVKQKKEFSNISEVFCNLSELSRHFKDDFCLPMLNLLHETIGKFPLYGMPGLLDELKVYILQFLPVEGVVSMSAVNRNFNLLANSPFLWKYLLERDFNRVIVPDVDTKSEQKNWKQIYKKEYLSSKRKPTPKTRYPSYRIPQIFSVGPDYFGGGLGIHFDPPFPDMYPRIHPRYPPLLRRPY